MPRQEDIDRDVRDRLRALARYFMQRRGEGVTEFSHFLGTSQPTMSDIVNGKKTMGLDVLLKMSSRCRKSIDDLVDTWPPQESRSSPPIDPQDASPVSAAPVKHRKTGR